MSDAKFSSGPWVVRPAAYGFDIFTPVLAETPPQWVASMHRNVGARAGDGRVFPANHEVEANASLIASAPELYGALQFILAFYEPGQRYLDTEAWKHAEAGARAAMAKARGE